MLKKLSVAFAALLLWGPFAEAADAEAADAEAADGGVLVLGGTGKLGSEIVKDLVEAGDDVTVLVRPTSNRERLAGLELTYVTGDLLDDADVERVFKGASYRAIVDASGQPQGGDVRYYPESQRLISKWAAATGVRQIILHGATGSGDSAELFRMENVQEMRLGSLVAKDEAETILTSSGVPYTIMRHMTLLPLETTESGNARMTTDHTVVGAISRDGLARLTLECIDNDECLNTIFHVVDDDVELTGRYTKMWERYELVFKPEVLSSQRKQND